MAQDVTRSWFAVFNNPQDRGYEGTPQQICEQLRDEWIGDSTTRSGAWAHCVSADKLHHVHMILEDAVAMRFSVVKKTYAIGVHLGEQTASRGLYYQKAPLRREGRGSGLHRSCWDYIRCSRQADRP